MEDIKKSYAFIITSKLRLNILKLLSKGPLKQSEVADKLNKKQPNISIALRDLVKERLVECLTPGKKSWKVYEITDLGKEVLKKVKG